jgi:FkbM family methyltransferase
MIRCATVLFLFVQSLAFTTYYSQCDQDKFVNEELLHNFRGGVFLDVGANDGISLSNTYFFEKELGWTGICLEPIPSVFERLQANRRCRCIRGCASTKHNTMKRFLHISGPLEMLSGLVDKFDPKHKTRIERLLKDCGGSYELMDVPCYNLNNILENTGITHIHFFSIDTEGGEFDILKNFDFSKCQVDVIAVEDNYKTHPFTALLKTKGFDLVKTLEQDLIFVNKNFTPPSLESTACG